MGGGVGGVGKVGRRAVGPRGGVGVGYRSDLHVKRSEAARVDLVHHSLVGQASAVQPHHHRRAALLRRHHQRGAPPAAAYVVRLGRGSDGFVCHQRPRSSTGSSFKGGRRVLPSVGVGSRVRRIIRRVDASVDPIGVEAPPAQVLRRREASRVSQDHRQWSARLQRLSV